MTMLFAGQAMPRTNVDRLGGGVMTLGTPEGGHDWQLIVVYRGLHCPICKRYLAQLDELAAQFHAIGVDVVAVSGDPEAKAKVMVEEKSLEIPVGYGMTLTQMAALGLYISDPRSPEETDRPFPEPGVFVVNAEGNIQILDISNAPFARPDLQVLLNGVTFVRDKSYPIRGTHTTALGIDAGRGRTAPERNALAQVTKSSYTLL